MYFLLVEGIKECLLDWTYPLKNIEEQFKNRRHLCQGQQTRHFRPWPALGTRVKIQLHRGGHDSFETTILPRLPPGKASLYQGAIVRTPLIKRNAGGSLRNIHKFAKIVLFSLSSETRNKTFRKWASRLEIAKLSLTRRWLNTVVLQKNSNLI